MHNHRSEAAVARAVDPASGRLTPEQVIDINRSHLAGQGWDAIAAANGTGRKNVQRIVQGRRHKRLHPSVRPELYAEPASEPAEADPLAEIIEIIDSALREARDRILREIRSQ